MGTIKVMGQGEMKFAPDVTRVSVDIDALHTTYQEAFEAGAKNTDRRRTSKNRKRTETSENCPS